MIYERLKQAIENGERCVLFTVLEGDDAGRKLLAFASGETLGDAPGELAAGAEELLGEGRNRVLDSPDDAPRVFAEIYGPPPRLFVYGAVDLGEALCRAAKLLGWQTILADARAQFTTRERIPSADELIVAWPEEALAQVAPDRWTAVVVLTHDDKFDIPALLSALATDAFYVGALGSRRNQDRRRARLLEEGLDEAAIDRISGPCGLDIGADSQPETALSILGEILALRAHREGGRLKQVKQRIHAEVDSA